MDGIKTFRKRLGCNQQELAERLEISANTISQWESGTRKPSYEILKQLLELGATMEELFGIPCNCRREEAVVADTQITRDDVARMIADALEQARSKPAKAG